MDYIHFLLLLLIPVVSELNHLGGQSTDIPYPRIICRVIGIPLAVTAAAFIAGIASDMLLSLFLIYLAGMALWAVPHWGQMFMAINGTDCRDYKRMMVMGYIADFVVDVHPFDKLTPAQCRAWGMVWGIMRGGFRYPMYLALSYYFTPWAAAIGLLAFLQGIIYRLSADVLHAEYKQGAMIGGEAVAILLLYLLGT